MSARGLAVDAMEPDSLDALLDEIHALSLASFTDNPYYSAQDIETFRRSWQSLRPLLDPRWVLLARDGRRRLAGFLFGYADPLLRPAGQPVRLILKTLATHPDFQGTGIGRYLVALFHARAQNAGFREVIHALMHVRNTSMRLSAERESTLFRRYALFEHRP
jgi:GNAT superfamily N-acetyltransferase